MKKKIMLALCLLSIAGYNNNVYAEETTPIDPENNDIIDGETEETVYEKDIPADKKDQYYYVEDETKVDYAKDLTEEKANELKVLIEANGFTKAILRSYIVKTGEEINHVEKSFESLEKAMEYVKSLEDEGYEVSNVEFVNDTEVKSNSLNETYDTLEEAEKALEDFKKEYNENIDEKEIVDNETDKVLEEKEGTVSYDTYEEAEEALNEFLSKEENQSREFYFEGSVVGPKENGTFTTTDIDEKFESKEEALEYLEELEEAGYEILNFDFTNDTEKKDGSLNETYDTLEEAEKALEEFKKEYSEGFDSNTKPEKIHNEGEDVEEELDTVTKDTYEEAETEKDTIEGQSTEDVIYTATISDRDVEIDSTPIDIQFDTEDEAEAYIEQNGDTLTEETKVNEILAGTATKTISISKDMKTYILGEASFVVIRKGNKAHVWTPTALDKDGENEFKKSYAELPDTNVEPKYVNKATFIAGLGEFASGAIKAYMKDNKLYMDIASNAESKLVQGLYVPETEYHVVGARRNFKTVYDVKSKKTTKGYDYKVTASGKKTVTLKSGTLTGKKKIENKGYFVNTVKKDKTHTVNIKAEKTITLESGVLNADTKKDVLEELYAVDVVNKKFAFAPMGDGEEENPKTGDDGLIAITIGGFSMIGMLASSQYLKRKKDNKAIL